MIPGIVAGIRREAPSGDPMDDEFSGSSLDAKWTWRQQFSATAVVGSGVMLMTADGSTADPTVQQIYQPLPGATGIFRSRLAGNATVNFAIVGLHLRDSSSGRVMMYGWHKNDIGSTRRLIAIRFNSETSYNTNAFETDDPDPGNFQFIELELTSSNIIYRTSLDGSAWTTRLNETKATFLAAPDQIGFAVCSFGASAPTITADWFRRIA